jgi:hypothetical protein
MRNVSPFGIPARLLVIAVWSSATVPGLAAPLSWSQTRDDFLKDPAMHAVLMGHCKRGRADNQVGLSMFNDAWVQSIYKLRFDAGVDNREGTTTKAFLAGLSAAASRACPGIW